MKKKITLELEDTAPLQIAIKLGIFAEKDMLQMAQKRGNVPLLVESCEAHIQMLLGCLDAIKEAPWED